MKHRLCIVTALTALIFALFCTGAFAASFTEAGQAFVDGEELESGLLEKDGVFYIRLSEAVKALGSELQQDGDVFSFAWRKSTVTVTAESSDLQYRETRQLEALCVSNEAGDDLYVPAESFCAGAEIGTWYDEEYATLYCTPGAGDWELAAGYDVPVIMYHGTGHANIYEANLIMPPEHLEEQLEYLVNNGYTTIWFEDLWHVEDYEKPVILVFDDGWENNYRYLTPALEKYDCKATVAIVEDYTKDWPTNQLATWEVQEMAESGRISFQSHAKSHVALEYMNEEKQREEMESSRIFITRLVGKEPFVLVYPYGSQNDTTLNIIPEYYRFGVKMQHKPELQVWNTGDDPYLIWRYFAQSTTKLDEYQGWLEDVFGPAA